MYNASKYEECPRTEFVKGKNFRLLKLPWEDFHKENSYQKVELFVGIITSFISFSINVSTVILLPSSGYIRQGKIEKSFKVQEKVNIFDWTGE